MAAKTTYALLIYRAGPDPSPAEDRRALAAHRALQSQASARGELHAVARLAEVSTAKTVRLQRGAHATIDGPYIETKEWLVGFYLISGCADSLTLPAD